MDSACEDSQDFVRPAAAHGGEEPAPKAVAAIQVTVKTWRTRVSRVRLRGEYARQYRNAQAERKAITELPSRRYGSLGAGSSAAMTPPAGRTKILDYLAHRCPCLKTAPRASDVMQGVAQKSFRQRHSCAGNLFFQATSATPQGPAPDPNLVTAGNNCRDGCRTGRLPHVSAVMPPGGKGNGAWRFPSIAGQRSHFS